MRTTLLALAGIMALAISAVAWIGAPVPEQQPTARRDGGLPIGDLHFLKGAAEWTRAQRELARLAQASAGNENIEALAERVDGDLRQSMDRLERVAGHYYVDLNDGLGPEGLRDTDRRARDTLGTVTGERRGRAWVQLAIGNYQRGLELYAQGASSSEAEIKAYADEILPMLKAHLSGLQKFQQQAGATQGK